MNNYSYHHKKGPPKMVKDLKQGNDAHLRQSLLDISQIQNLSKIFASRKNHYKIDQPKNQQPNKKKQPSQAQQEQNQFSTEQFILSPQENLQLIKKQRITNKMKDKLNQMFRPQQVKKFKMRKPVIHNMLEQFKSSFRVEQQLKFREALKQSEKNLEHIKINSKKRLSSNYVRTDTSYSREKFLSISTGKPVLKNNQFPTFQDYIKGKHIVKEKPKVGIDVGKMDNFFTSMITQPLPPTNVGNGEKKSLKDDLLKNFNRLNHFKNMTNKSKENSPVANFNIEDQSLMIQTVDNFQTQKQIIKFLHEKRSIRSKSAINPNKNFKKSQQSSKKIISLMQTYYSVKKQKNKQCDSIVEYLKKDRPLTSHLRRKNYKVIGKDKIQMVNKYRQKSEEQRIKILEKNYGFYVSLLKIFEHCKYHEISTSLNILNRLKQFFESEYVLFEQDVGKICYVSKGDKVDFGVEIIRENMIEYARKQQNMSTQNSEFIQFFE